MTKIIPPALLAILLCTAGLHAQEQIAVIRKDGLLVFLPDAAGQGSSKSQTPENRSG